MKLRGTHAQPHRGGNAGERASILIIVMWVALGLVGIALYFANSMTLELKAAGNRTAGLASDQAIEGAARYVSHVLANYATNGNVPDLSLYNSEAVQVGGAHFWLIGRDNSGDINTGPAFGLVDEAAKLNVNSAGTNALSYLPNMTYDFAQAIVAWRGTNANSDINYAMLDYSPKQAPFETLDELRLVYGATIDLLAGEDINRNGVLDANEKDVNSNGQLDPGLFEYTTVYSREPNIHSDGSVLTNASNQAQLRTVLTSSLGTSRATQVLRQLGFGGSVANGPGPGRGAGATNQTAATVTFPGMLDFYLKSGLTADEFALVANNITTSTQTFTRGRVNINTASATVLSCLPGMDIGTAQQLVNYRQQNPTHLNTIAWIVDALGASSSTIRSLRNGDYITVRSFQYTADIAAVGPFGRGYRRTRFVFDLCDGTPKVIYRQDLSRLGWALGDSVRDTWVTKATQ